MGFVQQIGARAGRQTITGSINGNVFFRNQQCADGSPNVADAGLEQPREIVDFIQLLLRAGFFTEYDVQVAVADTQIALQRFNVVLAA